MTQPPGDYLTLADCAKAANVAPEIVRQWCIRWRAGVAGGLPYVHVGAKPEAESKRVEYRVLASDLAEFLGRRRRDERAGDRRARQFAAEPLPYSSLERARSATTLRR